MRSGAGKPSRRMWLPRSLPVEVRKCVWRRDRLARTQDKAATYATILLILPADHSDIPVAAANPFIAADVVAILRERGWLVAGHSLEQHAWCERAASMLGGHAADRAALADLLKLVFQYDAREIISKVESHVVLSRYAARGVLRAVALLLLAGAALAAERFKESVKALKDGMDLRGSELCHPVRLALA